MIGFPGLVTQLSMDIGSFMRRVTTTTTVRLVSPKDLDTIPETNNDSPVATRTRQKQHQSQQQQRGVFITPPPAKDNHLPVKKEAPPTTPTARRMSDCGSTDAGVPPWTSMSFACGGWLQFYMYGVARALQAAGYDSPDTVTYCGCSAGALTAVGLAIEGDFDGAVRFCKETCVPQAWGHVKGLFKLGEYVSECIDMLVMPNYKPLVPGQLQLAVTKLPFFQAERVTEFASAEALKEALMASVAAYPAAPLVFRNGQYYMDGGVSDFQPVVDADTITVSPFYFSDCDIRPSRYVPLWWAFLPPKNTDTIDWLYALGWEDCLTYLEKRGLNRRSERARNHLQDIDRTTHPYDTPRRVSVHRVLGYDLGNLTCEYGSFALDFMLLVVFVVLWKPLALALIYLELSVHVGVHVGECVACAYLCAIFTAPHPPCPHPYVPCALCPVVFSVVSGGFRALSEGREAAAPQGHRLLLVHLFPVVGPPVLHEPAVVR